MFTKSTWSIRQETFLKIRQKGDEALMVNLNSDAIVLNIEENLVQVKISVIMMYELDNPVNQFQKLKYALFKLSMPFSDVLFIGLR